MSDLLQSGQHPDADHLSAFIEHALPAHEQEETLAHLAICPHCRSIVALSIPPAEELPRPHPEPSRRPWFSGWNLVWPAGVALAALVLAGIYIRNGLVVEKHVTPVQTAQSAPPVAAKQLPPPTLALQSSGSAARKAARHSVAPAPETTSQSQAVDRLSAGSAAASGAATQSSTVSVDAANQAVQTASPAVGMLAVNQARAVPARHGLPSGLPALSTVANARQVVAIDTHNTLFSSNDAGGHWNVINQPWQGHAVKVELVPISYPASTRNRAADTASLVAGSGLRDSVAGPRATLSGEITDPAGASIPNASVAVTNSLTQAVRKTKTDPAGRFTVDQLEPGNYRLQAEAPGFTTQQISGLALNPAEKRETDLTLALGSMAETVEVQGQAKPATSAPPVQEKIAVAATPPSSRFEITTDNGEHWTSIDGRSWQRKDE